MSQTFSLVCHETRQALWIGQGRDGAMTTLYAGEDNVKRLHAFLRATQGKTLVLLCDDTQGEMYEEYQKLDDVELP